MTRKNQKPIKQMHSKRTGLIITVALFSLIALGSVWFFMGYMEAERLNDYENEWRLQSCEEMKFDLDRSSHPPMWQYQAYNDKGCND